ncbi:AAA family ATPase [Actinoallomurus purpureus]|uniref:ATP-binding protein n=1 Tax=Actinoallomurus purpureus TaxID=478114 RepID=UPI00209376BE|nr:AAA family ATPase [Actinoallomurus purpureus]MCO6006806.1 AAA family ATPase [Actinoallomurus purpureus]
MTSFVGRGHEISAVKRLIRRHRLVTVTGGPGVGKTRLSQRVAGQLGSSFADGVRLVELAALKDARFLAQTVGDAVGVPGESRSAAWEVLARFLAEKNLLLVLDNCEHLVDSCALLVADLLQAAPELRILATSRQALHVAGEWLMELPPLPVPQDEQAAPACSEAMRLFAERAATALPGFAITDANRASVAEVCRRLDGIPLAIELAAVRVRAMPVETIMARLGEHSLQALGAGAQVTMPRLQTMRSAIDWSFHLCSKAEQRLWARASVFNGGFDIGDAEQVCSGTGIEDAEVLTLLAGLVDKSVLTSSLVGEAARYRMLEPIREYGAERLARSGQARAVRTRHRDHFADVARQSEGHFLTSEELQVFNRLGRDYANVRSALEFCVSEPGQAGAGLRIAGSLWHYWTTAVRHREGRYWLDRVLSLNPEPSPARAKALWVNGWLALLLADWEVARSLIDQCAALAERLGDESARAHATLLRGMHAFFCGDLRRAVAFLEDALARLRALDDRGGVWMTLRLLTYGTALLGEADRSRVFGEQCIEMADRAGASLTYARALGLCGVARWLIGDHERATCLARERLRVSPCIDGWGIAHCLEVLAWDAAGHDPERAARLLGCAHAIWRFTGAPLAQRHLAADHRLSEQRTRAALGEETFGKLSDEGARLPIDQAIAYALDDASWSEAAVRHRLR